MRKAIALLFLSALVLSGCAGTSSSAGNAAAPDAVSAATEKRYREGELREYDGERLDPAAALPIYVRDRVSLTTDERMAGLSL